MPRKRNNPEKTSTTVLLEGENFLAFLKMESLMKANGDTNGSKVVNEIIKQWRTKIPAVMRGYEKP